MMQKWRNFYYPSKFRTILLHRLSALLLQAVRLMLSSTAGADNF